MPHTLCHTPCATHPARAPHAQQAPDRAGLGGFRVMLWEQQRLAPANSISLGIPAGCSWAACQPQVCLSRTLGWFISLQGSHFGILILQPQPQQPPAHCSAPPRAGCSQSSPLLVKDTQIPTGIFLLPVYPGDGVVAVCILVIAVLDGVGGAGAVCRGSRGSWGSCFSLMDAQPSTSSHGSDLSPSPHSQPGWSKQLLAITSGMEGSGTGATLVGAATIPSPG